MPSDAPRTDRLQLLDRLIPPVDVTCLDNIDPVRDDAQLRKELRPHWELHSFEPDDSPLRLAFRTELRRLMARELAASTGYLTPQECYYGIPPNLWKLIDSPSGARFIDTYMYFGAQLIRDRNPVDEVRSPHALPAPPPMENLGHLMADFVESETNLRPAPSAEAETVKGNIELALKFLYNCIHKEKERQDFELWLRRLSHPSSPEEAAAKQKIYYGLHEWLEKKAELYISLPSDALRARFAIYDLYWLARILGADVASTGVVTYRYTCWLDELHDRQKSLEAGYDEVQRKHLQWIRDRREEALRRAFSLGCDLIQESVQIAAERSECKQPPTDSFVRKWRFVFDEEMEEIRAQRTLRFFPSENPPAPNPGPGHFDDPGKEWSNRMKSGDSLHDLVGLAFSGGGIRSATFNLGILEGLKEVDLLRKVDYISTVSGGGYIGAWLVANVKRRPYWLSKTAGWEKSIEHLRQFSNYLSPRLGILSADTWTMVGTWSRNTLLVQLVVFSAILTAILAARAGKAVFDWWGDAIISGNFLDGALLGVPFSGVSPLALSLFQKLPILFFLISVAGIGINLFLCDPAKRNFRFWPFPYGQRAVQMLVVIPFWSVSFLIAVSLWTEAHQHPFLDIATYSGIFLPAWNVWKSHLLIEFACLSILASLSFSGSLFRKLFFGPMIGLGSLVVLFASMCGIMRLFHSWTGTLQSDDAGIALGAMYGFAAYVWGPVLVMAALSLTIISFLGFLGRQSGEQSREWWTRMGSWLSMYGTACLIFSLCTIYGPLLAASLHEYSPTIHWTAVIAWVATTVGGLLAGNSTSTKGNNPDSTAKILKEILAKLGSILFIAGILVGLASLLQVFFATLEDYPGPPIDTGIHYWSSLQNVPNWHIFVTFFAVAAITGIFSWRFDINVFSLNMFYGNRLIRCYLGATRQPPEDKREPQEFIGFDERDDFPMSELRVVKPASTSFTAGQDFRGPFPIVNCALNLGGSADLTVHTRHSASFTLTPLRCGADRDEVGYVELDNLAKNFKYAGDRNPTVGQIMAVSGAAANPNMGYHTSPVVAFLLTVFNVRLGWWFPNPRLGEKTNKSRWFPLKYLVLELLGLAGERSRYVNVSDGGHFENLGVYELLRRRCKVVIASDSECDPELTFASLGNLIRIADVDFGAKIIIQVDSIRKDPDRGLSTHHASVGRIEYKNGDDGYFIYIKSSLTGDEDPAVVQYQSQSPDFPHETTADQFFAEDQFESYRSLGRHIIARLFRDIDANAAPVEAARQLRNQWMPATDTTRRLSGNTRPLDELWERLRTTRTLGLLQQELFDNEPTPLRQANVEEEVFCVELIQLMENVYLDMKLDDHWEHPDNRGWKQQFLTWVKSGTLQGVWYENKRLFGLRFQVFCKKYLGLG